MFIKRNHKPQPIYIDDRHIFETTSERDTYFLDNPNELKEGMYIQVAGELYKRWMESWYLQSSLLQGPKGDRGDQGPKGDQGDVPIHEWDGTSLRFESPDGWGDFVDLKGDKGDKGDQGPKGDQGEKGDQGDPPIHEWLNTSLRFQLPDGSWGDLVELQGPKGDMPNHRWVDATHIQFEKPDGTWGELVEVTPGLKVHQEQFTVTSEEQVFYLTKGSYIPSTNAISWYLHGIKQPNDAIIELDSTSFTFEDGLEIGMEILVEYFEMTNVKTVLKPDHEWNGTQLRFENPDQTWGDFVDLKGDKGDKGDKPAHEWDGTSVRFENPDGTWGEYQDLDTVGMHGNEWHSEEYWVFDEDEIRVVKVDNAIQADEVEWVGVKSKPAQATRWPTWDEITDKPPNLVTEDDTDAIEQVVKNLLSSKPTVIPHDAAYFPLDVNLKSVNEKFTIELID